MTVETATKISQLNKLWPAGTDPKSEGDDHLRLIKSTLQAVMDDSGTTIKFTQPIESPAGAVIPSVAQRGLLWGLVLSNDPGDLVNDIAVSAGSAASDDAIPSMITLAIAMTKRTDAVWAAGNNNGGFDGGPMPINSGAHCYLIGKSTDATAADIFFSAGLTPTLPSGWDRKRRIGSVLHDATQIRPFVQRGNRFMLNPPVNIRNATTAATDTLLTISGPTGVRFRPILQSNLAVNASSSANNAIADGDMASTTGINAYQNVIAGTGGNASDATIIDHVYSNTAQQVRFSAVISSGTINQNVLNSVGWWDDRGING